MDQTEEAEAFARYLEIFKQAVELGHDLAEIDAEYKDRIDNRNAIKKLARLAAKDAVGREAAKFTALKDAASMVQKDLFAELDV